LLRDVKSADIKSGMSCRAEIFTQSTPDALAVPIQAVLYQDNSGMRGAKGAVKTYVFVANHGQAHKTAVKTGVSNDLYQAILRGLNKGERVVTGPYLTLHHLTNGAAIVPLSQGS
jgi:HlyD family secretion protein